MLYLNENIKVLNRSDLSEDISELTILSKRGDREIKYICYKNKYMFSASDIRKGTNRFLNRNKLKPDEETAYHSIKRFFSFKSKPKYKQIVEKGKLPDKIKVTLSELLIDRYELKEFIIFQLYLRYRLHEINKPTYINYENLSFVSELTGKSYNSVKKYIKEGIKYKELYLPTLSNPNNIAVRNYFTKLPESETSNYKRFDVYFEKGLSYKDFKALVVGFFIKRQQDDQKYIIKAKKLKKNKNNKELKKREYRYFRNMEVKYKREDYFKVKQSYRSIARKLKKSTTYVKNILKYLIHNDWIKYTIDLVKYNYKSNCNIGNVKKTLLANKIYFRTYKSNLYILLGSNISFSYRYII